MQLNRIVLIGRLTSDPEQRQGNEVEVSKFRIAVNRRAGRSQGDNRQQEADFFNVVAFRQTARFVNQYLRRGDLVAVEGQLHVDQYTDKSGQRQIWVEVVADNVQSLSSRSEGGSGGGGGRGDYRDRDDFEDDPGGPGGGNWSGRGERDSSGGAGGERRGDGGPRRQSFGPDDDARGDDEGGPRPAAGGNRNYDQDDDDPFGDE